MVDRIATVETEVTKQLKTTLQLLQELTMKQDKHKEGLDKLDEGQHVLEEKVGTMSVQYKDLVERVEKLESKGFQGRLSAQSTTTTEPDGLGGKRVPALIVGGWNDDTPAGEVIEKATRALQQLQVDLDYHSMFVPGVRRGFGLIPLKGAREGENEEDYRQRIQGAVTKIRNAKLQTGHTREDTGQPRYMFLAVSQPPERRRRAKLAAKVKRCVLELGGEHGRLEVEFATGTVWYRRLRVSSASMPMKDGAVAAGGGWVDVALMARGLKLTQDAVKQQWEGLASSLK